MPNITALTEAPAADFSEVLFYARFLHAANRMLDDHPGSISPPAPEGFPPGWEILTNIIMTDARYGSARRRLCGFYAIETRNPRHVVIAFRDTRGWLDWWADFDSRLVPCRSHHGFANPGRIARGHQDLFESFSIMPPGTSGDPLPLDDHLRPVQKIDLSKNNLNAVVIGHGLGGALATLFCSEVASRGAEISLFTLGSACVGDQEFAEAFNSLIQTTDHPARPISASHRIWNWPDLIARLPRDRAGAEFTHAANGVEIDSSQHRDFIDERFITAHALETYEYCLADMTESDSGDEPRTPMSRDSQTDPSRTSRAP